MEGSSGTAAVTGGGGGVGFGGAPRPLRPRPANLPELALPPVTPLPRPRPAEAALGGPAWFSSSSAPSDHQPMIDQLFLDDWMNLTKLELFVP